MTTSRTWLANPPSASGMPEVSVGLPVYNGERYLAEAVQSICEQTFRDFELIISDNASTDRTARICQELASQDARIRYIRQPRNIGAARNFDFVARAAQGTFLKWAAANDRCDRTMLAKYLDVMRHEDDVVLCYGRTCLIDGQSNELGLYEYDLSVEQTRPSERFMCVRSRMNLNNAMHGLIRLQRLRQTRIYSRLYPSGDLILMAELALYGTFRRLPDVLFYRRMDEGAASGFLSDRELRVFLAPDSAHKGFTTWRRHWDCCWSVLRAPIAWEEKMAALNYAVRSAYWDRQQLWSELRQQGVSESKG
jgi:glycosyltransferase involved in cell wall biosynthesis